MQNRILIVAGFAAILLMSSVFTVKETERAIKFRLGEIVSDDYEPGLHFKLPLINNVKLFDARIQNMDSRPERFLTAEKKNVIVDSFVKWRIGDVRRYYTAVSGDPMQANLRLDQVVKDAARSEFSKRDIRSLVSEDRTVLRNILVENIRPVAEELGIELVDIQVKRIDLPSEVSSSVYRRMEAERARVAREFRSQGAEAAERIKANADRQYETIVANAFRDAEAIRGQGDAAAAETYAAAYSQDPEFYAFYRSLNAYRSSFAGGQDMLVLEPDSEFFKYFKQTQ